MSEWTIDALKAHFEALLAEKERALLEASQEREKAAAALRIEMARAIDQGDDRLREHIANQIAAIQAALTAEQRASDKFEDTVVARFAQVNEFRGSLDDLGKQMATRRELETATSTLSLRIEDGIVSVTDAVDKARQERQHQIDDLRATLAELRSRLDVGAPQIPELQKFVAQREGHSRGVGLSTSVLAGGLAALATFMTIIVIAANYFSSHH